MDQPGTKPVSNMAELNKLAKFFFELFGHIIVVAAAIAANKVNSEPILVACISVLFTALYFRVFYFFMWELDLYPYRTKEVDKDWKLWVNRYFGILPAFALTTFVQSRIIPAGVEAFLRVAN